MAGFLKSNTNFIKRGNQVTRPASGTTAGRPTNPAAGEFRFNEDTNKVEYYDSAAWKNLSTASYTISGRDITFTSPPPNTHRIYAIEGFDATDIA